MEAAFRISSFLNKVYLPISPSSPPARCPPSLIPPPLPSFRLAWVPPAVVVGVVSDAGAACHGEERTCGGDSRAARWQTGPRALCRRVIVG